MVDIIHAIAISTRLSKAHTEGRSLDYLQSLTPFDSGVFGACLRRLGWWFPFGEPITKERIVSWLFREDQVRLDFSDGTKRYRSETPEERLIDAVQGIESIAVALTIPAKSCLSVSCHLRSLLEQTGRSNPPLCARWERGWPDDLSLQDSSEGMRNVTNDPAWLERARFDEFCLRFDGELLDVAFRTIAAQLGVPEGPLKLRDPTDHILNDELYVRRDLVEWMEGWQQLLIRNALERGELPFGWEPNGKAWPSYPIQDLANLSEWLATWLSTIHRAHASNWATPELYLADAQRELRNARKAMWNWGAPAPARFDDNPGNVHEAERQLERMIDHLTRETARKVPVGDDMRENDEAKSVDASTPTSADFPPEWEFQFGSILTPLEGTFEFTPSGPRLQEARIVPSHPVRNVGELLKHLLRWRATFVETRQELELAKQARVDAEVLSAWTARLLDETRRELRNAQVAVAEWIDDPAGRPKVNHRPVDIHDARLELTNLIDQLTGHLLGLPNSSRVLDEIVALPRMLRKIVVAIGSTGNTNSAKQLALEILRTNPLADDHLLLQRMYTRWKTAQGPKHESTMLLRDTLEQLAQLASDNTNVTAQEYCKRLETLAQRWDLHSRPTTSEMQLPIAGMDEKRDELLLALSPLNESGMSVIQIRSDLLDIDLLTVLHADRLIEFIRRRHCHVGPAPGELRIESGWEVTSNVAFVDHVPVRDVLKAAIADEFETPELRVRVRLTRAGEVEASRVRLHRARSVGMQLEVPSNAHFESQLGWPEWPYRVEQFFVLYKVCKTPTQWGNESWVGWCVDASASVLDRIHSEPVAGSVVNFGPITNPRPIYLLNANEIEALKMAFPHREVEEIRLSEVHGLLCERDLEPSGLDAKSLMRLLLKETVRLPDLKSEMIKQPNPIHTPEHAHEIQLSKEIARISGFGEEVILDRTEGVDRLVAILTKRRISVLEVARISAPQTSRVTSRRAIAEGLTERHAFDALFENVLGTDCPIELRESIQDLISDRNAAMDAGNYVKSTELTAQIDAVLGKSKSVLQQAAATVKKSLDRTYRRLRKDQGKLLAKHFEESITRPRSDSDYVYAPNESAGKISWNLK